MYQTSDRPHRVPHGEPHARRSKNSAVRPAPAGSKRPAQFSRPELLREFELLMLTALVETARRDRSP
jgi:hypothetical protein